MKNLVLLCSLFFGLFSYANSAEINPGFYRLHGLVCSSGAAPQLLEGYKTDAAVIPEATLMLSGKMISISAKVRRHLSEKEAQFYRQEINNLSAVRENLRRKPASRQTKLEIMSAEKFIVNSQHLLSGLQESRFMVGDYIVSNGKIILKKPTFEHVKVENKQSQLTRYGVNSFPYIANNDLLYFSIEQDPISFSNWSMLRCPNGNRAYTVYKKDT